MCHWRLLFSIISSIPFHGVGLAQGRDSPMASVRAGSLSFVFATTGQGRKVLGDRDTFVEEMSLTDRKIRMQSDRDLGMDAFLDFAKGEVIPWRAADRQKITAAIESLDNSLGKLKLPDELTEILLVHTTGKEESGAAYTRGNAIILPVGMTGSEKRPPEKLLAHELFHIISRHDTRLRDDLYRSIGFVRCGQVRLPKHLADLKLTNPDAPTIVHRIDVRLEKAKTVSLMPILYAKQAYATDQGKSLFQYLEFRLMEITPLAGKQYLPRIVDGKPVLHTPEIPDFHRQIGRNTRYIIHPEEILADNFAMLVTGEQEVPDAWVIDAIRKRLYK